MKTLVLLFTSFLLLLSSTVYADETPSNHMSQPNKGIVLYEQPDAKSKTIGIIAPGNALIPIFSQNNWLKVADPSNGNVGWIPNAALQQKNLPVVRTFSQTIVSPGNKNFQLFQSNDLQAIDEKQVQELLRNWQLQQKNIGQAINQILNQSITNFNTLLRTFNEQEAQFINTPLTQPSTQVPATKPVPAPTE